MIHDPQSVLTDGLLNEKEKQKTVLTLCVVSVCLYDVMCSMLSNGFVKCDSKKSNSSIEENIKGQSPSPWLQFHLFICL